MRRRVLLIFLLALLCFSFVQGVSGKNIMLEYVGNEYYETSAISYNMEDYYNATLLYDFSLNSRHGNKTLGSDTEGMFGRALQSPIEIMMPNLDWVDIDFTAEFWLYLDTITNFQYFFRNNGTYPYIIQSSGEIRFYFAGGAYVATNVTIYASEWRFFAVTVNFLGGNLWDVEWWVNDTASTVSASGYKQVATSKNDLNQPILLGRYMFNSASYQYLGRMDDFRLYQGIRTKTQLETDMLTSTAVKFTVENLVEGDVVQLWWDNHSLFEQQTAGANGEVEFNVFTFSGKNDIYKGVVNVYHEEIHYEGYVMVLDWGDIYVFRIVLAWWEDMPKLGVVIFGGFFGCVFLYKIVWKKFGFG